MKKLITILFILISFNSFSDHATTKLVNGKRVALTAEEIATEEARWDAENIKITAYKAQKIIDDAKTQEQKIDDYIQRDAILKVMFDLIVANSGKTKAEVLTMIKVEQNK